MRHYSFAAAPKRDSVHWKQHDAMEWGDFVDWLDLDNPSDHKDCGGYVPVVLQETQGHSKDPKCVALHRNKAAVVSRSIVTLDADTATVSFLADAALELSGASLVFYTTWSHTPEAPRWRLLVPLAEDVTPDEYRLIAEAMMHDLGLEQFDRGSREPERLMYRPSTQGGDYQHVVLAGDPVDPQVWLARAAELKLDNPEPQHFEYRGDSTYEELTFDQQLESDRIFEIRCQRWRDRFSEVIDLDEKEYLSGDRGWEATAKSCAFSLACMAFNPWMSIDLDGAELTYHEIVPDEILEALAEDNNEKWNASTISKASRAVVEAPPWEFSDFDVWAEPEVDVLQGVDDYDPNKIDSDLQLGKRVAREYLRGQYLAWGKSSWARWDGARWDIGIPDDHIAGRVREALLHIRKEEIRLADAKRDKQLQRAKGVPSVEEEAMKTHSNRMKAISRLSSVKTLDTAKRLARPDLIVDLSEFDGPETADLLNCNNGVVDLRTGELRSHDSHLKFTKITTTDYVPGARHPDWDKCLASLPLDVLPWVQRKFGQGVTGHAPPDEIVLFMRGGGENGKTTFLLGMRQALGDYYTTVPDKVLNGGPNDHSTEFMPLRGARLAVIEELPGGDWLTGTRLKKAEGSETGMSARYTGENPVTWVPSHMLVATTNHLIHVTDNDHGTRRRLCDLNFPYTFSGDERDSDLKRRIKQGEGGQHRAVLAWLVEGARLSYEETLQAEHMPMRVRADTDAWLALSNPAEEFLTLALEYSEGHSVLSSDVYAAYRDWAQSNGRRTLSDQNFWEKAKKASIFAMPDVRKDSLREHGTLLPRDYLPRIGTQRVVTCVRWTQDYRDQDFDSLAEES